VCFPGRRWPGATSIAVLSFLGLRRHLDARGGKAAENQDAVGRATVMSLILVRCGLVSCCKPGLPPIWRAGMRFCLSGHGLLRTVAQARAGARGCGLVTILATVIAFGRLANAMVAQAAGRTHSCSPWPATASCPAIPGQDSSPLQDALREHPPRSPSLSLAGRDCSFADRFG